MKTESRQGVSTGGSLAVFGCMVMAAVLIIRCGAAFGQANETKAVDLGPASDFVTINVEDANIAQVLTAFSRQTGRSMVIGPEVIGKVNVRMKNVKWDEALTTILKPYGYGYYTSGETIVICFQDKVPGKDRIPAPLSTNQAISASAVAVPEPLISRVFSLKYLDASDVEDMIKAQLSPAGRVSKLVIRSQSWKAETGTWGSIGAVGTAGSVGSGSSAEGMGRLRRVSEDSYLVKGKTIVVADTAMVISRVDAILSEVDKMPVQVLIEAKFIEVESDLLRDIGVEFGTGAKGAEAAGVQSVRSTGKNNLFSAGAQQISGTIKPGNFTTLGNLSATRPFDAGLSLAVQQLTSAQLQVLMHLLQEDGTFNILSSPRILTLNNQDATIIVGTKFPIINSQSTSAGVTSPTISTSLEYYENVGIQLKVMPQICDGKYINLIVHPSVREIISTESGKVGNGSGGTAGGSVALTEYPVLSTREAETQVLVQNGRTIVIGGLLKDKKTTTVYKVPFLGSIPLVGALFRRETVNNQKVELLIFLTATIRSPEDQITEDPSLMMKRMGMEDTKKDGSSGQITGSVKHGDLSDAPLASSGKPEDGEAGVE